MYFSIFTSSEYDSDDDINNELVVKEDDLCLICWLPAEEKNQIKILSEFSHIKPKCKCKPKLHSECINEWIIKTPSCPICRTKMNIIIFTDDNKNVVINCYIVCVSYTVYFLRVLCYTSLINLLCLLFYNVYCIYIMTNTFYQDDYGVY
jgi:hypothetical protein